MSDQNASQAAGRIVALYRYPVKGLTAEEITSVALSEGAVMPFDRAYAIENGPGPFDPENPRHLPKMHFVMLMRNEQLAAVRAKFDETTRTLTLTRDGAPLANGNLESVEGRAAIEQTIATLIGPGMRGPARVVSSPGHSFTDLAEPCLHIINLETVRALEKAMGSAINPLRFRPNIIIDGLPAWSEFDLVGSQIAAGDAILVGIDRTERCAATNVDPGKAVRDLKIPSFLSRTYGHTDFGIYARVTTGGTLKPGDTIKRVGPPLA